MVYYFWTLSRRDWLSWVSKTCLHWNQPGNILVKDHKQMWRRAQRYTCCLRGADDEARERRSCARPTEDKETVPWLVLRSPLKDGKDNEGTRNCSTYLTPVHIHGNSGGKISLPRNLIQDQVKVLHFSVPSVDSALSLMNIYKSPGVQQSLPTCSCISIFLLLWMWEPFTQLCTYSQGQQLHVSFMQRTMFVSMVSPQEKRRHSLQSQWTQIHLIQTALGAEHVRHAYEVVPSPKIKHHSIFTEATKTTNETSDTWSHDLQDIQHQVTNFPLSLF